MGKAANATTLVVQLFKKSKVL